MNTIILSPQRSIEQIRSIIEPIYPLNGQSVSKEEYEKYLIHRMIHLFLEQEVPNCEELLQMKITGIATAYLNDLKEARKIINKNCKTPLNIIEENLKKSMESDDEMLESFSQKIAKYLGFEHYIVNSCNVPNNLILPFDFMSHDDKYISPNKSYLLPKKNSRTGINFIVKRHKDYLNSIPKKCLEFYIKMNNRKQVHPISIRDARGIEIVINDETENNQSYMTYVKRLRHTPFLTPAEPDKKEKKYMNCFEEQVFVDYNKHPKDDLVNPETKRSYMSTHLFYYNSKKLYEIKITRITAFSENYLDPVFGHKHKRKQQLTEIVKALIK